MKRDFDLIKAILHHAEEHEGNDTPVFDQTDLPEAFHGVSEPSWVLHCNLIVDRGLVKGSLDRSSQFTVSAITWEGYDFLDHSRSPEVWNAAKSTAGHLSLGAFVNILTHLETTYGFELLKPGLEKLVELAIL